MFKVIVSHRSSAISSAIAAALLVSGCALSPNAPPPVDMPVATTPPVLQPLEQVAQTPSGSLFNASRYRPAFEDRRARMVGDLVTVQIQENVTARQNQDSGVTRKNSLGAGVTALPFFTGGATQTIKDSLNAELSSKSDFSGKGSTSNVNTFIGAISTTVVEVLPNGHLVVSGEKQVGVNQNVDVLRFTGTVDPRSLRPGSTVASTQVANVRVESRGRGQGSEAQSIGWLSRFFLNVMPF
ncbi:flagellar basal body L-ring protein FlgH [Comamonas suwonensis]|uniref:flagellar basal body L-ring protein FlgH n=1 Tax=Comamonas suwonensis TaxID=2606214 RepID=UPI00145E59D7|nr:flagellar basal body L-ring protein FlgH [Comamonas suwonensis]MBI1624522.1 flagellar basal body L-ring protein FlgH [Comamonas suwonensis]